MKCIFAITLALDVAGTGMVSAQEVQIRDGLRASSFSVNGQEFRISRSQENDATLTGSFALTSRPCPDFCIQPMDLSRFRAAPSARLGHLSFESDGAFPAQC